MTKHNAKRFFNSVCTFLQDHGYLDADWYAEEPKAKAPRPSVPRSNRAKQGGGPRDRKEARTMHRMRSKRPVDQFMKELNDYEVADLIDTKERSCEKRRCENCYYDWMF